MIWLQVDWMTHWTGDSPDSEAQKEIKLPFCLILWSKCGSNTRIEPINNGESRNTCQVIIGGFQVLLQEVGMKNASPMPRGSCLESLNSAFGQIVADIW
jgi:hypothetical protein